MKYLDETGLARLWEKIKNYVDSHSGGGGGSVDWEDITNKPTRFEPDTASFVVETYSNHSSKNVTTSGVNTTYNINKEGYLPIGVVGFYVNNANVYVRACYLTNIAEGSATINYYMRTAASNTGVNSVTQTTRVLWVKI